MIRKYPINPMAKMMSYDTRQRRFNEDKNKLIRENAGLPGDQMQEKFDRLVAWWNV